ncbi:Cof-type HAD-IIB family hydrolase [Paenibacillus sp. N1-5-1-14]|uniref:Cof-type HAD-IIB family hydrolase n=1 Tax=Paenibacillus radicibacter TaxID=2972488 RepID=UPI0021593F0C|nr:Cof-type HAD-IIB family hydrolase [Paenibacillus radicibacter]MCR8645644.1 Cof-type HAD-IIB family hydrolase [Paenibacillus radicibacter]
MKSTIVFFDIDGTLLNQNKEVLDSTRKAIKQLQDKGVYTAIATGRTPHLFDWLCEELNINTFVSMNGQYVVFEGEIIYNNPMNAQHIHELAQLVECNGDALAYVNEVDIRSSREGHLLFEEVFGYYKMEYPIADRDFYKHTDVHQVTIICEQDQLSGYVEKFPQFNFVPVHEGGADILPKGCSKASGIAYILERGGFKLENTFAFGDGDNDIEMLGAVGVGVAMGNASTHVQKHANYITASCDHDGIYEALVKFELVEKDE